jgi:hypothetical protein
MRDYQEYYKILELWERGYPKQRIEYILEIPRGTIRDCINKYGTLKNLEDNKAKATKSTSTPILERIHNPENIVIQEAYAYALGIYLGDGYIVRNARIYYLRITLDTHYPNIIETCKTSIQLLLPDNRVNVLYSKRGNWCEVVSTYKFWPDIFPQHGSGYKHDRSIELVDWQRLIIGRYPIAFFKGLYHSDGSRFSNVINGKDYPRYQFTQHSNDIRRLFCQTCDVLGLHWTEKSRTKDGVRQTTDIFISKRKDVEWLDKTVGAKS